MDNILTIILSVVSSGAVFGFIQFLVSRSDKKRDKQDEILRKLDAVSNRVDEQAARIARANILRFEDELVSGQKHSREYFRSIIEDDIKNYELYCERHHDFENGYTVSAKSHILRTYERLIDEGEFKPKEG